MEQKVSREQVMPQLRGRFIVWPEHKQAIDASTICSVAHDVITLGGLLSDLSIVYYTLLIKTYDGQESCISFDSSLERDEAFDRLLDLLVLGECGGFGKDESAPEGICES